MVLADQLEEQGKWEGAYKNFFDCALKAKNQIANCSDPNRKKQLTSIFEKATIQA